MDLNKSNISARSPLLENPGCERPVTMPMAFPLQPTELTKKDRRILEAFFKVLTKGGPLHLSGQKIQGYTRRFSSEIRSRIATFGGLGAYLCSDPRFTVSQNVIIATPLKQNVTPRLKQNTETPLKQNVTPIGNPWKIDPPSEYKAASSVYNQINLSPGDKNSTPVLRNRSPPSANAKGKQVRLFGRDTQGRLTSEELEKFAIGEDTRAESAPTIPGLATSLLGPNYHRLQSRKQEGTQESLPVQPAEASCRQMQAVDTQMETSAQPSDKVYFPSAYECTEPGCTAVTSVLTEPLGSSDRCVHSNVDTIQEWLKQMPSVSQTAPDKACPSQGLTVGWSPATELFNSTQMEPLMNSSPIKGLPMNWKLATEHRESWSPIRGLPANWSPTTGLQDSWSPTIGLHDSWSPTIGFHESWSPTGFPKSWSPARFPTTLSQTIGNPVSWSPTVESSISKHLGPASVAVEINPHECVTSNDHRDPQGNAVTSNLPDTYSYLPQTSYSNFLKENVMNLNTFLTPPKIGLSGTKTQSQETLPYGNGSPGSNNVQPQHSRQSFFHWDEPASNNLDRSLAHDPWTTGQDKSINALSSMPSLVSEINSILTEFKNRICAINIPALSSISSAGCAVEDRARTQSVTSETVRGLNNLSTENSDLPSSDCFRFCRAPGHKCQNCLPVNGKPNQFAKEFTAVAIQTDSNGTVHSVRDSRVADTQTDNSETIHFQREFNAVETQADNGETAHFAREFKAVENQTDLNGTVPFARKFKTVKMQTDISGKHLDDQLENLNTLKELHHISKADFKNLLRERSETKDVVKNLEEELDCIKAENAYLQRRVTLLSDLLERSEKLQWSETAEEWKESFNAVKMTESFNAVKMTESFNAVKMTESFNAVKMTESFDAVKTNRLLKEQHAADTMNLKQEKCVQLVKVKSAKAQKQRKGRK